MPDVPPSFDSSHCRFAVPREADLDFLGDDDALRAFAGQVERVARLFGPPSEVDIRPFLEAARLLYEGPWVAERYAAVGAFIDAHPGDIDPTVRSVISNGKGPSAVEAFEALYRLSELRQASRTIWQHADVLLTPTAPTIYTLAAVAADPLTLNANLGRYTNFVNLMDLAAVAVPAGFLANGLPFGSSLVAPAFSEHALLSIADRLHRDAGLAAGATGLPLPAPAPRRAKAGDWISVAVCGAHMSGLPLNAQLTSRGGRLVRAGRTAAAYRLFALTEFDPPRPGMVRDANGQAIEIEVWQVPAEHFGNFVDSIPSPLGIGTIMLDDGSEVRGFLCESFALKKAQEITQLGSWRKYVATI
jgi:allophanate hydrolase